MNYITENNTYELISNFIAYCTLMKPKINNKNTDETITIITTCHEFIQEIIKNLDEVKYAESLNILSKFSNIFESFSNPKLLSDNWKLVSDVFDDFIIQLTNIKNTKSLKFHKCTNCGHHTYYIPNQIYNNNLELLFNDMPSDITNYREYQCANCSATFIDRFFISIFKKFELLYTFPNTYFLGVNLPLTVEKWILTNCFNIQYINDINTFQKNDYIFFNNYNCDALLGSDIVNLYNKLNENGLFFLFDDNYSLDELNEMLSIYNLCAHQISEEFINSTVFIQNGLSENTYIYLIIKKELNINDVLNSYFKQLELLPSEMPLVSVLLPCYNHEHFVEDTIKSIINQTYKNIEILVSDDGSSDNSVDVLKKYSKYFAKEFYFEKNVGERFKFLLEQSSGKYISDIGSDDIWEPNFIEKQVKLLERNPKFSASFTWCNFIDENFNEINDSTFMKSNLNSSQWIHYFFYTGNCLSQPSVMIHRDIYTTILDDESTRYRQLPDYILWIRLLQKHEIYILPEILTKMRRYNHGYVTNTSAKKYDNICRSYNEDMYIWYDNIKNMDTEFFRKTFSNEMLNKEAITPEEIACEKYFILKNHPSHAMKFSAMLLFFEYNKNNSIIKCFEEKYNYTRKDFYEFSATAGLPSLLLQIQDLQQKLNSNQ